MPAFRRSELTSSLVRYLSEFDKGTRLTYGELARLAGVPITSNTPALVSARHILQRDYQAVWCCRRRVGIWRLSDPEIAARQGLWFLPGARNKLKAGEQQADVVKIDQLDIVQQARFATHSIIRELAREALSKATARRVEKVARGTGNDLPAFSALEWLITLSPRRSAANQNG